LSYITLDGSIATVDSNGKITGKSIGSTTLIATYTSDTVFNFYNNAKFVVFVE